MTHLGRIISVVAAVIGAAFPHVAPASTASTPSSAVVTPKDAPVRTGTVLSLEVPSPRSGLPARAPFVYLPPAWFDTPRPKLPVLVLFGGSPGTPADWVRSAGADKLFDWWAVMHGGVAPVVVMPDVNVTPNGDTECVDGPRGRAETYVLEDLRPFVIRHFGVLSNPEAWAAGGLSEGGTCALVLTLRHPDVFGTFADFGGSAAPTVGGNDLNALYGGDVANMRAHDPVNLLRGLHRPGLGGWFESGTSDGGALSAARRFAPMVAAAGGEACMVSRPGAHDFPFWHDALRHAQPWLMARLGLTPEPPSTFCP